MSKKRTFDEEGAALEYIQSKEPERREVLERFIEHHLQRRLEENRAIDLAKKIRMTDEEFRASMLLVAERFLGRDRS